MDLSSPVEVRAGDVERVHRLVEQFQHSLEDRAALLEFGRNLNKAGGYVSGWHSWCATGADSQAKRRPWHWLAAVASDALAVSDAMLAAQIAVLCQHWDACVAPSLTAVSWFDGVVVNLSDTARRQLYTVGYEALRRLPNDATVQPGLSVNEARLVLAYELVGLDPSAEPETVATARHALRR